MKVKVQRVAEERRGMRGNMGRGLKGNELKENKG